MKLTLDALELALQQIDGCRCVVIALSGGMDSVVLLHGLSQLKAQGRIHFESRAVHVNHGLQSGADSWQSHCEKICQQLGVDLISEKADLQSLSHSNHGIENAARQARYQIFERQLQAEEVLLLAHHRDDQMETLLLRLMRGSGSRGLRGIPKTRKLGAGFLFRPLLDFDSSDIEHYARSNKLQWVEDDSNKDQRFDRNYTRHTLLPLIETRWPGYRESWSKSAVLAGETENLLHDLAAIDFAQLASHSDSSLHVDRLLRLEEPRRRNLLRYWLQRLELPELGWNRLQQLSREVLLADDSASLNATGFRLARFRGKLYALRDSALDQHDISWRMHLHLQDAQDAAEIELPDNGSLSTRVVTGSGLSLQNCKQLQIRYRQGGETCRLRGRPTKTLKKILQEQQIEPWFRDRIPLLYAGQKLVCIPGIGVSEGCVAGKDEPGVVMAWRRPKLVI